VTAFRLAQVTDPHFRSWAGLLRPHELIGKRAAGMANLVVNRWRKHRMELLAKLREDLRTRAVDHLALTGDLSNISQDVEWHEALHWLEAYGATPGEVTVIPGNHDAYVADVVRDGRFERLFAAYQTAELRTGEHAYPFVRFRGEVALIGVNSCVATGDLGAWGQIGEAQLGRLEALLADPEVRRRARVVLIHHPPVMHRPPENRNLRDRAALVALLGRVGAELVIHGHDHRDLLAHVDGPDGTRVPIVGAGSASYAGPLARRARYNVYEIEGRAVTVTTFAHDDASDSFRGVARDRV
jgi:3',5'-cyclic AMP phosphodiesterase CpdA